jgi:cytochrome oxidase assembly protein ShyY1
MRRLLTPRWIAGHLLALVTVTAFVNLGLWQLRRLEEKRDLNASVEQGLEAEPVAVAGITDEVYVRVTARGTYAVDLETLVLRSRKGESGYHVLTPFTLDDGRTLLVDRGWVPATSDRPADPSFAPPGSTVAIEGLLWPAQEGSGVPESQPDVVRRIDPAIVAAFGGIDLMPQYLVLTTQDPPGETHPIAEPPPPLPEGQHLSYAVQWFLFAAVVVAGYPVLLWRTAQPGRESGRRSKTTDA